MEFEVTRTGEPWFLKVYSLNFCFLVCKMSVYTFLETLLERLAGIYIGDTESVKHEGCPQIIIGASPKARHMHVYLFFFLPNLFGVFQDRALSSPPSW